MKKKYPSKKGAIKKTPEETVIQPIPSTANKGDFNKIPAILLAVFGFLLYANTFSFQFALDDKLYVTHNQFTKKGIAGIGEIWTNELLTGFYGERKQLVAGGRYRPIPLTLHALEWELMGPAKKASPDQKEKSLDRLASFSHFFNALMYAVTGLLLFSVLIHLFPSGRGSPWIVSFAFLATAFFLAHPLHTEVVANIKSRDELMSVVGALGALLLFLKYLDNKNIGYLIGSSFVLMGALFCKESSITFMGIIPLTAYFFTRHDLKKIGLALLPLLLISGVYILIRTSVLGSTQTEPINELMNNPFVGASDSDKYATVLMTMGMYVKLLFFPHPLTHDYYPYHIPIVSWSDPWAWGSVVLYAALIIIAIVGLRKKTMYSYGILVFLGSFILFSNLLFPIGTFMNERFMYIPSIGFSMVLAYGLQRLTRMLLKNPESQSRVLLTLSILILLGFSAKTFSRNFAWENDYTLATTDVNTSAGSAKARMAAGDALLGEYSSETDPEEKNLLLQEAIKNLTESKNIYPKYKAAWHLLGNAYFYSKDYGRSFICFQNCLKLDTDFSDAINNLEIIGENAAREGQPDVAIDCYNHLINKNLLQSEKDKARVYSKLGEVYGKHKNDLANSLKYLQMAFELDQENSDILQKLGVVYAIQNQPQQALEFFNRALVINPESVPILQNIGYLYRNSGQEERAQIYFQKVKKIDPSFNP